MAKLEGENPDDIDKMTELDSKLEVGSTIKRTKIKNHLNKGIKSGYEKAKLLKKKTMEFTTKVQGIDE